MRLIDSDALLELYADTEQINFAVYNVPVPVVRQNILDMPTIEVEPVRYGRVIVHDGFEDEYYEYCSECKSRDVHVGDNYCPNCGAKLDKEA